MCVIGSIWITNRCINFCFSFLNLIFYLSLLDWLCLKWIHTPIVYKYTNTLKPNIVNIFALDCFHYTNQSSLSSSIQPGVVLGVGVSVTHMPPHTQLIHCHNKYFINKSESQRVAKTLTSKCAPEQIVCRTDVETFRLGFHASDPDLRSRPLNHTSGYMSARASSGRAAFSGATGWLLLTWRRLEGATNPEVTAL